MFPCTCTSTLSLGCLLADRRGADVSRGQVRRDSDVCGGRDEQRGAAERDEEEESGEGDTGGDSLACLNSVSNYGSWDLHGERERERERERGRDRARQRGRDRKREREGGRVRGRGHEEWWRAMHLQS